MALQLSRAEPKDSVMQNLGARPLCYMHSAAGTIIFL